MDTYARRRELEAELRSKGKIIPREQAAYYNVSENTIRNDIDAITPYICIQNRAGQYGGCFYCGERYVDIDRREGEIIRYALEYCRAHNCEIADDSFYELINKLEKLK